MTDVEMASCQIHVFGESWWTLSQYQTHLQGDGLAPKLDLCQLGSSPRRGSVPFPMYGSDLAEYFLLPRSFFLLMNLMERSRSHWAGQTMRQLGQPEASSCGCWIYVWQVLLAHVWLVNCWEGAENMPGEPAHGLGPEPHCQGKEESPRRQLSSQP